MSGLSSSLVRWTALLTLPACWTSDPASTTVPAERAVTYALAVDVAPAEVDVPKSVRPDGRKPPERIPLAGWASSRGDEWTAELPVRTRNLFFSSPPPGMRVVRADGTELPHRSRAGEARQSWSFDETTITANGFGEAPTDLFLVYPFAVGREARLNLETSGATDATAFVRTTVQAGPESRAGLLLPAPGHIAWDLKVPEAPTLYFTPGMVPPEVLEGARSSGAALEIRVDVGGESTTVWKETVREDHFEPVRLDLDRWAGRDVRLSFHSDPMGDPRYDYVFVGEPVLASRKDTSRRVVLLFVDTLRPDHTSVYGYERETTPALARWAENAAVFENARSVAPWTLPSSRTALTGRQPEYYETAATLQGTLRQHGYATAMLAGNLYLGANFDMNKDWGLHRVTLWPSATEQVDQALAWMKANEGRDSLLLLHFMDAHLPYQEPEQYRHMFAGDAPEKLPREQFHRTHVVGAKLRTEEERQYVRDRYDNTIRYVDDEIARLLATLDDDDVVVFFADHGEEFWEHKGYEHGHTLFDELLRVPFVVRAPDLPAGRLDVPVSLLDLTPTVLDALGLPVEGMEGLSLLPAARGDMGAVSQLRSRKLGFGRPLYGSDRWGVLVGDEKYSTSEGREALYDLGDDPGERSNRFLEGAEADPGAPYRPHLAEALGREVGVGYRLSTTRTRGIPSEDLVARAEVPGGFAAAWPGSDATLQSEVTVTLDGDAVVATWKAGYPGAREVWLVPRAPMAEATHALRVSVSSGDEAAILTFPADAPATLPHIRVPASRARISDRMLTLGYGIAPVPDDEMRAIAGYDPEIASMLEAMGYAFDDSADKPKDPEGGE